MRDQAVGAGDLDRAVTGGLDRVTPLTRAVGEHRDHGPLDVIAEDLVDLVADLEVWSHCRIHGKSFFATKALRPVRPNYGLSVYDVAAAASGVARMERSAIRE